MKIGLSLETTRVLRDTWHTAINHDWYDFLQGHTIVPLISANTAPVDVAQFDAIILCGGNDMTDFVTWRNNNDPQRDFFETALLDQAVNNSVPVVGICRGSHFINKHQGGTLRLLQTPYDNVQVDLPGLSVTCHHTIAIDQLAPGFEVLLQDSHGVIELAVNKSKRMLGIGWHPERPVNTHTRPMILDFINNL
jgi:N5-(cytidine 5'-diphosphoramidyl)-L-glutamine hydrolase